jgi:hypothetical protein
MAKPPPEHKDVLGRLLEVGNYVAYCESNMMRIGKIDKLNAKMIRIATGREWRYNVNKYSKDTVKLDGPDLTMYLLTK